MLFREHVNSDQIECTSDACHAMAQVLLKGM